MTRACTSTTIYGLAVIIIIGLIMGCGGMMYKPSGPVNVPADKIVYEVTKEADIDHLSAYIATYKGWQNRPVWHFEIGIKNPTDKPHRYRVRVVLPDQGASGGGLIPLKGKPPAVAPGKVEKGTYPVNYEGRKLAKVVIVVETVDLD